MAVTAQPDSSSCSIRVTHASLPDNPRGTMCKFGFDPFFESHCRCRRIFCRGPNQINASLRIEIPLRQDADKLPSGDITTHEPISSSKDSNPCSRGGEKR